MVAPPGKPVIGGMRCAADWSMSDFQPPVGAGVATGLGERLLGKVHASRCGTEASVGVGQETPKSPGGRLGGSRTASLLAENFKTGAEGRENFEPGAEGLENFKTGALPSMVCIGLALCAAKKSSSCA